MNEIEELIMQFPQIAEKKNDYILNAIKSGRLIPVNKYLDEDDYEKNENELHGKPLILVSIQATLKYLCPSPEAEKKGDTIMQNVKDMVCSYQADKSIFELCNFLKNGEREYSYFEGTVMDKKRKNVYILQFTDAEEWVEDDPYKITTRRSKTKLEAPSKQKMKKAV